MTGSRDTHKVSKFAFFCRTKQGSRDTNYCNIFIVETMNNKLNHVVLSQNSVSKLYIISAQLSLCQPFRFYRRVMCPKDKAECFLANKMFAQSESHTFYIVGEKREELLEKVRKLEEEKAGGFTT